MINFNEYIEFFRHFDLLLKGKLIIFTGYMLDFVRLSDFLTSCREVKMLDNTEYIDCFRLFDYSTSWWEVKMINFTEYIDFFRLFDLLLGRQTD